MSSPSLQVCQSSRRLALHIYLLPAWGSRGVKLCCSPAMASRFARPEGATAYTYSIRCASLGLKEVGQPHLDVLEYHFDKIIDFKGLPN